MYNGQKKDILTTTVSILVKMEKVNNMGNWETPAEFKEKFQLSSWGSFGLTIRYTKHG